MKIAYKIFVPILSVAVVLVLLFVPLFHISISSSLAGNLSQNVGIPEYSSVFDFIKSSKDMDEMQSALLQGIINSIKDKDSTLGSTLTNVKHLNVFFAFAAALLLFVLLTCVFAIITKRYFLPAVFSALSLISAFGMNKGFEAFAKPLITGQISLSSFLSDSSGLLSGLLGSLVKVDSLELSFAYQFALLLLIVTFVFNVVVFIKERYA